MTEKMRMAEQALEQGKGILRLAPTWVPRSFCRPGKRIKLHPDDYFILGQRGGIDGDGFLLQHGQKMVPILRKMKD